jgi:hypothetical protein
MKTLRCAIFGLVLYAGGSSWAAAAEISSASQISHAPLWKSGLQKIQLGRCLEWHDICRVRWGFSWRFRRCMIIHDCF